MANRHRPVNRHGRDAGAVVVQLVVIVPALMLILLTIVQLALVEHAHHIAQSAAARALAAARAQAATGSDGTARAQAVLHAVGDGVLHDTHVTVTRTATTVRVEVSGTVEAVVPGLDLRIHAVSSGPVDRYTDPAAGGA